MKNWMIILTKRLVRIIFNLPGKPVDLYFDLVRNLLANNGIVFTIAYLKQSRLHITRYLAGKPLLVNRKGVSLVKGWPKRLLFLKELYDSKDNNKLRYIYTLLAIPRGLQFTREEVDSVKPDYSSITEPRKGFYTVPSWFVKKFVNSLKFTPFLPDYSEKSHYLSMKEGPNGKSTYSAESSILQLGYPELNAIYHLIKDDKAKKALDAFYTQAWNRMDLLKPKRLGSGRLGIVNDPELKKRVIAMVDYHSQWVLRPIHNKLLEILSNIDCDRTYTQDPVHQWDGSNKFHSLDLSSATDRFPVSLQTKVLREIFGHEFAIHWERLLTARAYFTPEGKPLHYAVGQPMGAYSSWAAFALTHHLVVQWANYLAYKDDSMNFSNYILLGDDIVIKDDKIASNYISIMTKLGVEISEAKTHVSNHTYEFAKRWIRNGIEVSGLPLRGIFTNIRDLRVIYTIILEYSLRTPLKYKGTLIDLFVELFNGFKIGRRYYTPFLIRKKLDIFYTSLRYALGLASYDELRKFFMERTIHNEDFVFPAEGEFPKWIKGFLSQGMAEVALKANQEGMDIANRLHKHYKEVGLDVNTLGDHPLVHGIFNAVQGSIDAINSFGENNVPLIDTLEQVVLLKVDHLVSLHRNISDRTANLDQLWKKALETVKHPNPLLELYQGSAMISGEVDSLHGHWQNTLLLNYRETLSDLKLIKKGELIDPLAPQPDMNDESYWLKMFGQI
jgi:hypothetical protein